MKLHAAPIALVLALLGSAPARAETVYYSKRGSDGIESATGRIVRETSEVIEIETADGETVSVPRGDVYQVIRRPRTEAERAHEEASKAAEPAPELDPSGAPDSAVTTDTANPIGSTRAARAALARSAPRPARAHRYGIKGGMNFANLNVDPQELEDGDTLKSYAVGAWWGTPLNRRVALQAEALYSVRGDSESEGGYTASTRMSYIDVPVLAKIGFLHGAAARPSFLVGPSVSLNLSASSTLEGDGVDMEVDVKDQTRAIDLGVVVGGGVDFVFGEKTYGVELRYTRGLGDAVDESANGSAHSEVIAVIGSIGL